MNKQQQHSLDVIKAQAAFILRMAELERKRLSFARKRKMEKSYSSLVLHASKLGLHIPSLGTYYKPEEYIQNCTILLTQLQQQYEKA